MGHNTTRRTALRLGSAAAAGLLAGGPAWAQGGGTKRVKIGVMTDLSGIYADLSGQGSVLGARLAVEDAQLDKPGWTVEVVAADMQNKPDVGATIARRWFDVEDVDIIIDVPNSAVALALNQIVREKNRIYIGCGTATSALTGSACTPNTIHWVFDTYQLSNSVGRALTQAGGDSWFFIATDNAFGAALQADATSVAVANGAKVTGSIKVPLNTSDFSSALLQAASSGAKVIGLAVAGADAINLIKQAAEFSVGGRGQKLSPLVLFLTDVHALGLATTKGLTFSETFYWDLNDGTRAFSDRFSRRMGSDAKPTMVHAGCYSAVTHYLKALAAIGSNPQDGAAVTRRMKALPTDDPLFGKGRIQSNGRKIHAAYLFEVKQPSESRGAWDYYKVIATIPGEDAFRPVERSGCQL